MRSGQGAYFDREESMVTAAGVHDIPHVLETIAQRYVGQHPPHGPVFRVTRENPIRKLPNHLYDMSARSLFAGMEEGQHVYAWAKLWAEEDHAFMFHLRCFGPVRLYHNGVRRFGSAPEETCAKEDEAQPIKLKLELRQGWNHFVLELGMDAEGRSGAQFGTGSRKNKPLHFLAPSEERDGEEGWLYTKPVAASLAGIPAGSMTESATGVQWLPAMGGKPHADDLAALYKTVADAAPGSFAFAWTAVNNASARRVRVRLTGTANGPLHYQWQDRENVAAYEAGAFAIELDAAPGLGDLIFRCVNGPNGWGFKLDAVEAVGAVGAVGGNQAARGSLEVGGADVKLASPRRVAGWNGSWLHLGPFGPDAEATDARAYLAMDTAAADNGKTFYWTIGEPGGYVRPFLENELFGRWNYPLGVTLFGLLESSCLLERGDLAEYVARHVEFATAMYEYSLWDRERFGAAGLNNQLSDIDSLDDCGSFGALAILAGERVRPLRGLRRVSDDIAKYVMDVQDRMADGALYRRIGVSPSMHNTMWCDDMYMSVPFLCRYAALTGDSRYVDEAARQLLLYRSYLYMPEQRIMSHVFDVSRMEQSRTAWGRGNGWVFFSLATLLGALPKEHARHAPILAFYRELAEGYRWLQGENGLWHQVLTDPESYEEASCTSMFMYGFALGVRHGWLENPEPYAAAAQAGWRGLCERAIDRRGNLYGVCKGSSWSYQHAYYKHELGWNLNDTHGIGITLLAGIETYRMLQMLQPGPVAESARA
ncbi:glycoside hydrolase family 88/105 protein [Paenibacillus soyae]|uniref:Glycoside hydrolase family 88 protein n=1 Tax=Paenibacillus soyae TaxID=2969249 RepID=A0A9X2MVI1_9BACL|nr:glycoside hydrolase family 88 protein [Paenibacillus soyae]MCR2807699.1 glycoside hydrolase family 88 protein [Paenibacillus soyae]